ncbi:MAG: GNAT family N-acetyltransferase [Anaerolineae bacterium]|nr:GNAT family N-acetyltransferase [Anaerolineae bacterium]
MTIESLAKTLQQTPAELIQQADVHTRTVQTWLSSRSPEAARWEGVGVNASSTGLSVPLLNLALSKGYPPKTPEALIETEIERVKAFFAERNVPWYWWVGPNPQPPTLPQLLQKHNIWFDPPPLPAMLAPLPARPVDYNRRIRVWRASTPADLAAASTIRRIAFRFPAEVGLHYFDAMADDWLANDTVRLYLAEVEAGTPAGILASVYGAGVLGFYILAVLPEWRRRDVGKALMARLLADSAADGHPFVVLTASRAGYPLYQQFGFEHIFDYQIYGLP